jgi:uncharacterized protein (DUF1330 family)
LRPWPIPPNVDPDIARGRTSLSGELGVTLRHRNHGRRTMKTYLTVTVAMFTGAAIGGFAVQGLQAQAKPPVFQVTIQDASDLAALNKEFVPLARPTITANGGVLLASGEPTMIEGSPIKGRVVINQWQNIDQLKKWHSSPEYKKAREIGDKYAKWQMLVVDGVPK